MKYLFSNLLLCAAAFVILSACEVTPPEILQRNTGLPTDGLKEVHLCPSPVTTNAGPCQYAFRDRVSNFGMRYGALAINQSELPRNDFDESLKRAVWEKYILQMMEYRGRSYYVLGPRIFEFKACHTAKYEFRDWQIPRLRQTVVQSISLASAYQERIKESIDAGLEAALETQLAEQEKALKEEHGPEWASLPENQKKATLGIDSSKEMLSPDLKARIVAAYKSRTATSITGAGNAQMHFVEVLIEAGNLPVWQFAPIKQGCKDLANLSEDMYFVTGVKGILISNLSNSTTIVTTEEIQQELEGAIRAEAPNLAPKIVQSASAQASGRLAREIDRKITNDVNVTIGADKTFVPFYLRLWKAP